MLSLRQELQSRTRDFFLIKTSGDVLDSELDNIYNKIYINRTNIINVYVSLLVTLSRQNYTTDYNETLYTELLFLTRKDTQDIFLLKIYIFKKYCLLAKI